MQCRSCKQNYQTLELFSLGSLAISDFVAEQPKDLDKHELTLVMCKHCSLVQLSESIDSSKMYGKYWYRSGTNDSMKNELKDIVESTLKVYKKQEDEPISWLDIGSNDGTLLSFVPDSIFRVGIDPANNSFTKESKHHANEIVQDFFPPKRKLYRKFDIITAIAMFYDLDEPETFLRSIHDHLKPNGLLVLQLSYTPLMVEQLAFDNICSEHVAYYTLATLEDLLKKTDFQIRDCQLNDTNGGSFRIFIQKKTASPSSFGTAPYRDVCQFRTNSLRSCEYGGKYWTEFAYKDMYNHVLELKNQVVSFIKEEKSKGKSIWIYGASTKGNTLLQYFGLDHTLIDGAAERSPYKFGLRTIGTDIPIYSEEYFRAVQPDYTLILPWHFIDEFKIREHAYLQKGGKFIVPCPKFEVISL